MSIVSEQQLIQEIHAAGRRLVLAVTGGGSGAISSLLGVPGASRSVLAAVVPYASQALEEWLGGKPDEFCSAPTARAMAMAAFLTAKRYEPEADACGVGCTSSLATDRPKRGPHRTHIACQTAGTTAALWLELAKDRRSRAEEEAVVTAVLVNCIAEACGVAGRVAVAVVEGETIQTSQVTAPADQQALLAGRIRSLPLLAARNAPAPAALISGAFNPLHEGHRTMAALAAQVLGKPLAFEISILNVDKPPLDFIEIAHRAAQFSPDQAVWLTRAPRFTDKAELFPGATFVVGADTIARIGQPRYYDNDEHKMLEAIERIAARGCRFLVFGRVVDGSFRSLHELPLPAVLASLCQEVPEARFRDDVSSTQLRQSQAAD